MLIISSLLYHYNDNYYICFYHYNDMKKSSKRLVIDQMDQRMAYFKQVAKTAPPASGWIKSIRMALNMTLHQCAGRMGITASSVRALEQREVQGAITIKGLKSAANALGMDLIYGFIPKEGSLTQMIEQRAISVAREIVMRTNTTMSLEDQQVNRKRLEKAVQELADEIKREMPKYLWD